MWVWCSEILRSIRYEVSVKRDDTKQVSLTVPFERGECPRAVDEGSLAHVAERERVSSSFCAFASLGLVSGASSEQRSKDEFFPSGYLMAIESALLEIDMKTYLLGFSWWSMDWAVVTERNGESRKSWLEVVARIFGACETVGLAAALRIEARSRGLCSPYLIEGWTASCTSPQVGGHAREVARSLGCTLASLYCDTSADFLACI